MIKNMTVGQYFPRNSFLHGLDPRTKLGGTLVFIVSLFIADRWECYVTAAAFLAFCIGVSKVPVRYFFRGIKPILFLIILSAIFNIFLGTGQILFQYGFITITIEGIITAIYMCARLMLLVMGASLMTFTTTPNSLTDGMERGLGFLTVFKVPVHEIAMMMSIALRFIPLLSEETEKIKKAQMARGADFSSGNILARAKAMVPLLVPLFVSAFRRAQDLATAMEARCYKGGSGRTKMYPLKYGKKDAIAWPVIGGYLVLIIAERCIF